MLRRMVTVGAAAVLALTAACGGSSGDSASGGGDGGEGTTTVNVGVIPIADIAPLHLGVQQGFFEERGLEVETQQAQGGAAIVPGVASGEFQFGFSNVVSLMLARDKDLPIQLVANGNNSTGNPGEDFSAVVVPEDSSIEGPTDLQGKKVAVNTLQNIGPVSINNAIREAGGDPSENPVNYTEMALPDMQPALEQGNIDAAWVVEPFTTISLQAGAEPVLWNMAELGDNTMIAGYFTSKQYAQQNPEVVESFRAAMNESLQYAQQNRAEARDIITEYTEIEPEVVEEMMLPAWSSQINRESLQQWSEMTNRDGFIEEPVDLDALLP